MRAMVLERPGEPLKLVEGPDPQPADGEVRIRVGACGVCRTDLHVIDGELPSPKLPLVPGHEIVGRIDMIGGHFDTLGIGRRVGVPWLARTCGHCRYCLDGRENLCDQPLFTGYTRDGGYATHVIADARYVFPLPDAGDDVAIAPLLCAGLIGWRSLQIAGGGSEYRILWFRRCRPYHRASRALAGPRSLRFHQSRGRCRTSICKKARRSLGGKFR
jgi:propanol-preferring alcohol dehydrogenase